MSDIIKVIQAFMLLCNKMHLVSPLFKPLIIILFEFFSKFAKNELKVVKVAA